MDENQAAEFTGRVLADSAAAAAVMLPTGPGCASGTCGSGSAACYGFSVLYCMTTSLAEGGEGLGTLGLPAPVLRRLVGQAGFAQVRRVEMDDPFNSLYELAR